MRIFKSSCFPTDPTTSPPENQGLRCDLCGDGLTSFNQLHIFEGLDLCYQCVKDKLGDSGEFIVPVIDSVRENLSSIKDIPTYERRKIQITETLLRFLLEYFGGY